MKLEDLLIGFQGDFHSLDTALDQAVAKARRSAREINKAVSINYGKAANLNLTPKVDHRELEALNKHLDVKQGHVREVQRHFNSHPLKVKVDDSQVLQVLNNVRQLQREINQVSGARVNVTGNVTHTSPGQTDRAGSQGPPPHAFRRAFDDLPTKIAKAISDELKNVLPKSGGVMGAIGGAVSAPFRLATGVLGGLAGNLLGGISFGITQELSKDFGQGISQALNQASRDTIGSSKLLGQKLASEIITGLSEDLRQVLPDQVRSITKGIQQEVRSSLGEAEVAVAAAATRHQETQAKKRQKEQAFEQFTSERQETLRSLPQMQERSADLDKAEAQVKSELQVFNQKFQKLLRLAAEGLSPEVAAQNINQRRQEKVQQYQRLYESMPQGFEDQRRQKEIAGYRSLLQDPKLSESRRKEYQSQVDKLEAQPAESPQLKMLQKMQTEAPVEAGGLNEAQINQESQRHFQPLIDYAEQQIKGFNQQIDQIEEARRQVDSFYEQGRLQKRAVQGLRPKSNVPQQYQQIVEEVARLSGVEVTPDKIPQLRAVKNLSDTGKYVAEANQIQVRPELLESLQRGQATRKQIGTLVHEVRHAVQSLFGSAEGLSDTFENQASIELLTGTVEELRKLGRQIEASTKGGKGGTEAYRRATERDAYVFEERHGEAIYQQVNQGQRTRSLQELGASTGPLLPDFFQSLKQSQSIAQEKGVDITDVFQSAVSQGEQVYRQVQELQGLIANADFLPADEIARVQILIEEKLAEYRTLLERESQKVRAFASGETAVLAKTAAGTGELTMDSDAGSPGRLAKAAVRVGESALVQGYQTAAGTIIPAAQTAAGGLVKVAKSGYELATKLESIVFDLFTSLRAVKTTAQMVGGPLLAYGAATHLGAAGEGFGAGMQYLSHLGIDPLVNAGVHGTTNAVSQFVQGAVPHGPGPFGHMGTQFANSVTAQAGQVITRVGQIVDAAVSGVTSAVGGGYLAKGVAQKGFQLVGGVAQKQMQSAGTAIAGQLPGTTSAPFESVGTGQALKEFAYEAVAATHDAVESLQNTTDAVFSTAREQFKATADHVGQKAKEGAEIAGRYTAEKVQTGLETAGKVVTEKVASGLEAGANVVAQKGNGVIAERISGSLKAAAELVGQINNDQIRTAAESVVNRVRDKVESAAAGEQTITVSAEAVVEEPRLLTAKLPEGTQLQNLRAEQLSEIERQLETKLEAARAAEAQGQTVLGGSGAIAKDVDTVRNLLGREATPGIQADVNVLVARIKETGSEVQEKFRKSYQTFQAAIKSGDRRLAETHAEVLRANVARAKGDVEAVIGVLKQAGADVSVGSQLGNELYALTGTYTKYEKGVTRGLTKLPAPQPEDIGPELESPKVELASTLEELNETIRRHTQRLRQYIDSPQGKTLLSNVAVNTAGFAASQMGAEAGVVGQLSGDLLGALAARHALSMASGGNLAGGADLSQDLMGWLLGNATSLTTGIPGSGAAVAGTIVPQLEKLRQRTQGGEDIGPELESLKVDFTRVTDEVRLFYLQLLQQLGRIPKLDTSELKRLQELEEEIAKIPALMAETPDVEVDVNQAQARAEQLQKSIDAFEEYERRINDALVKANAQLESRGMKPVEPEPPLTGRAAFDPDEEYLYQKNLKELQERKIGPLKPISFDEAVEKGNAAISGAEQNLDKFAQTEARVNESMQQTTEGVNRQTRALGRLDGALDNARGLWGRFGGVIQDVAVSALALVGVFSIGDIIVELGRNSFRTALEMQQLAIALEFTTGERGADVLNRIAEESDRLGVSFRKSAEGYKLLSAATLGTSLEGQTQQVFKGLQSGMAVMALGPEQQGRAFLAFSQIAAKGRVSLEEFTQQLAETMPGALQVGARAMGVTTAELIKMIESGNVLAEDLLPKLAAQFELESASGLAKAANTTQAAINRLVNEVTEAQMVIGGFTLEAVKPAIAGATGGLSLLNENIGVARVTLEFLTVFMAGILLLAFAGVARELRLGTLLLRTFGITARGTAGALQFLGLTLKTVAAAAAVTAGIELLTRVANQGSKEIQEANKGISDSLDRIIDKERQAAEEARKRGEAQKMAQGPEPKPVASDPLLRGIDWFTQPLRPLMQGTGAIGRFLGQNTPIGGIPGIGSILSNDAASFAELERNTNVKRVQDTLAKNRQFLTKVPLIAPEQSQATIQQLKEIDQQIQQIQARQHVVRLEGSTQEVQKLQQELEKLQKNRQGVLERVFGSQGDLTTQRDSLERTRKELEALRAGTQDPVDRETANQLLAGVNTQIVETDKRLNAMKAITDATATALDNLRPKLAQVNAAFENMQYQGELQLSQVQTQILEQQAAGYLGENSARKANLQAEREYQQQRLAQLKDFTSQYQARINELTEGERQSLETYLGKSLDSAGPGDISLVRDLYKDNLSGNMESVLDARSKMLELQKEVGSAAQSIAQGAVELRDQVRQTEEQARQLRENAANLVKEYQDFMRGIIRQTKEIQFEIKGLRSQIRTDNVKAALIRALTNGSQGIFQGFQDLIISGLEETTQILQRQIEQQQARFAAQNSAYDQRVQNQGFGTQQGQFNQGANQFNQSNMGGYGPPGNFFPGGMSGGAVGAGAGSLADARQIASKHGLQITSTTGGKHAPGSYHYKGQAIDFSNSTKPTPQMLAFARELVTKFGSSIAELIYTPLGFGIKNGKQVPLSYWGPKTNAAHNNHVHVAITGAQARSAPASGGQAVGPTQTMKASYYGGGEKLNRHTASGEVFNPNAMTAAHRTLPFGTNLKVTSPSTGRSVVVKINDRGPAAWTGRSLDLSRGAAQAIGLKTDENVMTQVVSGGGIGMGGMPMVDPVQQFYDQAMQIGYRAYQKGDRNTALINFQRALAVKPGDKKATQAIQNMAKALKRDPKQAVKDATSVSGVNLPLGQGGAAINQQLATQLQLTGMQGQSLQQEQLIGGLQFQIQTSEQIRNRSQAYKDQRNDIRDLIEQHSDLQKQYQRESIAGTLMQDVEGISRSFRDLKENYEAQSIELQNNIRGAEQTIELAPAAIKRYLDAGDTVRAEQTNRLLQEAKRSLPEYREELKKVREEHGKLGDEAQEAINFTFAERLKQTTEEAEAALKSLRRTMRDTKQGYDDLRDQFRPPSLAREVQKTITGVKRQYEGQVEQLNDQNQELEKTAEGLEHQIKQSEKALDKLVAVGDVNAYAMIETLETQRRQLQKTRAAIAQNQATLTQLPADQKADEKYAADEFLKNKGKDRDQFLTDTAAGLYEAQASRPGADPYDAARLNAQAAELRENLRFKIEIEGFDQLAAELGLTAEQAAIAKGQLGEINQLNLESILDQADLLSQQIEDGLTQAFSTLFVEFFDGTKSMGDALKDFGRSVLSTIAQIFAQMAAARLVKAIGGLFGGFGMGGIFQQGGTVGTFAQGGPVGLTLPMELVNVKDGVPNYAFGGLARPTALGLAVMAAMDREGPAAVPIVASRGEQVLSTQNGDAQLWRTLKQNQTWDELRAVNNYDIGGRVGRAVEVEPTPRYRAGQRVSTSDVNVTVVQNIMTPDASSFRRSEGQMARDSAFVTRRAYERNG